MDGIGYWQAGNVISAMANYDYFAKTKVYQTDVVNTLNSAYSLYAHADQYGYNDDALYVVGIHFRGWDHTYLNQVVGYCRVLCVPCIWGTYHVTQQFLCTPLTSHMTGHQYA